MVKIKKKILTKTKAINKKKPQVGRPTKYSLGITLFAHKWLLEYTKGIVKGRDAKGNEIDILNPNLFSVPYVEQLAFDLDIDDDTTVEWAKIHPEFSAAVKKIKQLQKIRLLHKTMEKSSATGGIFQLKVNHGMVEVTRTDITSDGKSIAPNITIGKITENALPGDSKVPTQAN